MQIWLVWTDLEEAVKAFEGEDGLYGSRHLAKKLVTTGIAPRVRGFFLLDMIGDKDLSVTRETGSARWLQDYISKAANDLGYSQYFFHYEMASLTTTSRSLRPASLRSTWSMPCSGGWVRASIPWANSTTPTPTPWIRSPRRAWRSSAGPFSAHTARQSALNAQAQACGDTITVYGSVPGNPG